MPTDKPSSAPPGSVVLIAPATDELSKALAASATPKDPPAGAPEEQVTTEHSALIGGAEIPYRVTVGSLSIRHEDEGDEQLRLSYTAYIRSDITHVEQRPITFCFNGGPGSSSVWLHLGAFGPRRVRLDPELNPRPPCQLVDNPHSLLDVTDLVFIDPASTGWSRAPKGKDAKPFHGVKADVCSVAEFIRLYTTRHGRWASPKFLAGESYGTTRASGLALHLQEKQGMFLNGLILISCALDLGTLEFDPGNDLPYVLVLPAYAATAWYHYGGAQPLRELLNEVEAFALEEYAPALMRGARLPDEDRLQVAAKLSRYTGLPQEIIEQNELRVPLARFVKELLRERRRTVGRLDSRYVGIDRDSGGESFEHDPSFSAILGPYTAAFNQLMYAELGVKRDEEYRILTEKVSPWAWDEAENRYLNVSEKLRRAMSMNPHLRVFAASGLYDLATPYFATDYTFDHLQLDPSLRDNLESSYYEAGHMMYVHEPCLAQLKSDLAAFITRDTKTP